jgi:uncharacterized membrane protein
VFQLLLFLHIVLIFTAITLAYGPEGLLVFAVRSNRTEAVRSVLSSAQPVQRIFPIFFGLGGLFGLLAAWNAGFDLLAPWLVIAYVLFVVLTIIGAGFTGPRMKKLAMVVGPAPDGPLSPEARAMARDRTLVVVLSIDFALLLFLIFDMVVKPFS